MGFFPGALWTTHESKPPLPRQCLWKHLSWERTQFVHRNQAETFQPLLLFIPQTLFSFPPTLSRDSSGGRNPTFQGALLSISRALEKTSVEVKVFNQCFAMVYEGVEQLWKKKKKNLSLHHLPPAGLPVTELLNQELLWQNRKVQGIRSRWKGRRSRCAVNCLRSRFTTHPEQRLRAVMPRHPSGAPSSLRWAAALRISMQSNVLQEVWVSLPSPQLPITLSREHNHHPGKREGF